ncbi:hypothetical protein [Aureimonas phyllosphaerae]|uniref:HrgA protein n=1 Tax=Aureimonas phyllosphaerae TaxID=1166078 RepID=A0A7W6C278_9HYPH|nr:hypothetical protein [Aureimonas phyllosphaerae]MBB3938156.1 hypothetical protein [Aureimonas phyllosphaerae]MBB3962164.1 hypothetical protein [Aureimonas phyllosphaerae]SFF56613.1 hypothetical protein SAMN05216566_13016 [Aureimonas phyllosphaerae]
MARITTASLAAAFLVAHPGRQFHPREVAESILTANSAHFAQKKRDYEAKNPGRSVLYQLEREIYALRDSIERQDPRVIVESEDGIRFSALYSEDVGSAATPTAPSNTVKELKEAAANEIGSAEDLLERDLYPNLQEFLLDVEAVVSMRISESKSSNRRGRHGNMWLHPDVVGMYVPDLNWVDTVRECANLFPTRKARLISVEVKLRLSANDIRESFFQTVSNSQWANRSYLAATEVIGNETWRELEMLCALHGVGYIKLDPEDPRSGRILIPARERDEVDWASVNRIAAENADFRNFLKAVLNYLKTGEVTDARWERH